MPFLGLTRASSARKQAAKRILNELAIIDQNLWRVPVETRRDLVMSMRVLCDVPIWRKDLEYETIEAIEASEGSSVSEAFKDPALDLSCMQAYISSVGESYLDKLADENPHRVFRKMEIQRAICSEPFDYKLYLRLMLSQFADESPRLRSLFLQHVITCFEVNILMICGEEGKTDSFWGNKLPEEYDKLKRLKAACPPALKDRINEILGVAITDALRQIYGLAF
jgi:hypothetical protein